MIGFALEDIFLHQCSVKTLKVMEYWGSKYDISSSKSNKRKEGKGEGKT